MCSSMRFAVSQNYSGLRRSAQRCMVCPQQNGDDNTQRMGIVRACKVLGGDKLARLACRPLSLRREHVEELDDRWYIVHRYQGGGYSSGFKKGWPWFSSRYRVLCVSLAADPRDRVLCGWLAADHDPDLRHRGLGSSATDIERGGQ